MPESVRLEGDIAVDTEAMGLNNLRDRLCVVQLSDGNGDAHVVTLAQGRYDAPRLKALLQDASRAKLFHYGRFDIAILQHYLGVSLENVYCTKIASRLARTFTDRHSYKDICRELLGIEISKAQQSSDWGADSLTQEQVDYAASDVLHLHKLRQKLNAMLEREGRMALAQECFRFLPVRARLDLAGWADIDIFAH